MSAIRNSGRRSRSLYSPYNANNGSRKKAQSSWSFSGFFSLFNPLRSRPPEDILSEDSGAEDDASTLPPSPLPSSAQLGQTTSSFSMLDEQLPSQPQQSTSTPSPPTAPIPSAMPQLVSTEDRIAAANALLQSRVNQTLRPEDVKTISAILDVPPKAQPFRFSTTLSDEKKMSSPSPPPPTATSHKLLARNPNGDYLWDGTASAKRARNRFSSPAFGSSRLTSNRVTIPETRKAEEPKSDHKRRRVGDEAAISTSESSGPKTNGTHPPAPVAAAKTAQMVPFPSGPPAPKVNGHGPSRLGLPPKATTPIVPSPLRQAWSGSSSPSQSEANPQPHRTGSKPTKTANFMTELIKEVTPPKRPDLSNPYQAASPVAKVVLPRRPLKRTRATGKPTVPSTNGDTSGDAEKKPIESYSPQAIIEATLPKGSQRSRPLAHLDKVPKPTTGIRAQPSPELVTAEPSRPVQPRETLRRDTVEEVEDDALPATKKQKHLIDGQRPKKDYSVTVEEVPDVDMGAATAGPSSSGPGFSSRAPVAATITTTTRSLFTGFKATSVPKEPSKLRFSYQPEPAAETTIATTQPTSPVDTAKKTGLPVKEVEPSKSQRARTTPLSPRDAALTVPLSSLPSFAFSMVTAVTCSLKTTDEVKGLPTSVLPSFDFNAKSELKADTLTQPLAPAAAPVKAFDWAAVGMKPINAGNTGDWTCSMCGLQNPGSAKDKCTICDTPR